MLKLILSAAFLALLYGCANLGYYAQATSGHLQVMLAARPVSRIVDDPATDPTLREKLEQASAIRSFASRELALPENGSYRKYADLGRPYVVWNVFVAGEFSTELEEWCFLFVGCVNYRGFYSREAAARFAAKQEEKGLETYIGPVPAYSTLGYFDDPLLNTFMRFGEQEVARTIFHELAHQRVFVADDSTFNESFASVVENEAMRRWLAHLGRSGAYEQFLRRQQFKERFRALVVGYRTRLADIYAASLSPEEKRQAKAAALEDMRRDYASGLAADWRGAYDSFFGPGLNNASLGSVSLYHGLVPAFQALLEGLGNDLPRFYQRVEGLARLGRRERQAALERLRLSPPLSAAPAGDGLEK